MIQYLITDDMLQIRRINACTNQDEGCTNIDTVQKSEHMRLVLVYSLTFKLTIADDPHFAGLRVFDPVDTDVYDGTAWFKHVSVN